MFLARYSRCSNTLRPVLCETSAGLRSPIAAKSLDPFVIGAISPEARTLPVAQTSSCQLSVVRRKRETCEMLRPTLELLDGSIPYQWAMASLLTKEETDGCCCQIEEHQNQNLWPSLYPVAAALHVHSPLHRTIYTPLDYCSGCLE